MISCAMSGSAAVILVSSDDPSKLSIWLFVAAAFSDVFCWGSGTIVEIYAGLRRWCCAVFFVTLLPLRETLLFALL